MPSRKQSGVGVCNVPSVSMKKMLAPVASATMTAVVVHECVGVTLFAPPACFDKVQIM